MTAPVELRHRALTYKVATGGDWTQGDREDVKHWVRTGEHTGLVKGGLDGWAQAFADLEAASAQRIADLEAELRYERQGHDCDCGHDGGAEHNVWNKCLKCDCQCFNGSRSRAERKMRLARLGMDAP